jgi:hypothetical protein
MLGSISSKGEKLMKALVGVSLILAIAGFAVASPIVIPVAPEGDGQDGSYRSGFNFGWE